VGIVELYWAERAVPALPTAIKLNIEMNLSNQLSKLPLGLKNGIQSELHTSEKVQWVGQPIAYRYALRALSIVCFSLVWTALSGWILASQLGYQLPDFSVQSHWFTVAIGSVFLLIGVAFFLSPFWLMYKASQMAYVVTSDRAIIFDGTWRSRIFTYANDQLNELRVNQRADGSGDIVFERRFSFDESSSGKFIDRGFHAIADVRIVEPLVRNLAAGKQQRD
jgi:hypothetical protein